MKKDELNMEIAKTNMDLNKTMNEDNKKIYNTGASSTTEVNISIQEDFYSESSQDNIIPTYIINGTQAKFIDKDK